MVLQLLEQHEGGGDAAVRNLAVPQLAHHDTQAVDVASLVIAVQVLRGKSVGCNVNKRGLMVSIKNIRDHQTDP